MNASLEGTNVITYSGTTDTGMYLQVHVIAQGNNNLLNLLGQLTCGCEDERLTFTQLWVKLC